ncbi:hypothetical protein EBR96_10840, partial [bacterium]|nr:hypothetical protein [bacterium]
MTQSYVHSFHIPVMGTAFTIDTPIRVARFGISSVMSIGDDELCEVMRKFHAESVGMAYEPIKKWEPDYRARRITSYLNLVHDIVQIQIERLKNEAFEPGTELTQYFELLREGTPLRSAYDQMLAEQDPNRKIKLQNELREQVVPGYLDVNIMTKIDRLNYTKYGELLPEEFSDALSALRGFAESKLEASIVFSAGFNRRLYAYVEHFADFFPDEKGHVKKKVILKVSDFR